MCLLQINRRGFKFKIYQDPLNKDPNGLPMYVVFIYQLDKEIGRYEHVNTIHSLMRDKHDEYVKRIGTLLENAVCYEKINYKLLDHYLINPSQERISAARIVRRNEKNQEILRDLENTMYSDQKRYVPIGLSDDEVRDLLKSKQEAVQDLLEDIKSLTALL